MQYNFYVPKSKQTYLPKNPEAPKMATFTPALEERPPGPASVALLGVTRGMYVENARGGIPDALNADNMVVFLSTGCWPRRSDCTVDSYCTYILYE